MVEQGITLQCSSDLFDPLMARQIFNLMMKTLMEKINTVKMHQEHDLVQKKRKVAANISKKGNKFSCWFNKHILSFFGRPITSGGL